MGYCRAWVLLLGLVLVACGPTSSSVSVAGIAGTVVSTARSTIAGARVTINDRVAVTDDNGAFTLESADDANTYVAVRVKAPGFPEAVRRVLMPASGQAALQFTLRPVDQSQTFALPVGTQNAVFHLNRGVAGATLTIPTASLVDINGNIATGNANINLTFWSPDDDMSTSPGVLRASDGNRQPRDDGPIYLLSYGMVDIDIEQDGNKLQVAPGAALPLVLQTTASRRDALATRPASITTQPSLWTLNPNTGLWDEDVGDSSFDVTTGQLVATLHHLSTKNCDEPYTLSGPPTGDTGCITGRAYGACGQPLANARITLNVANSAAGSGIPADLVYTTDDTGTFKADITPAGHNNYFASATWNGHTTDMTQSPRDASLEFITWSPATPTYPRVIFVSLTCSDASGECQNAACSCFNDPTDPGGCMEALEAADPADVNGYNACWVNPLGANWLGACFNDLMTGSNVDTHYNTVWTNRTLGDLCSNCWPILDMVFKDVAGIQSANCTGLGANGNGCCPAVPVPGTYNVCADLTSPNRKNLSDPCSASTDTCCAGTSPVGLECADNLCVPNTDPEG